MKKLTNIKRITICDHDIASLYIKQIVKEQSLNKKIKIVEQLADIPSTNQDVLIVDVTKFVEQGYTPLEIINQLSRNESDVYCVWPQTISNHVISSDIPPSNIAGVMMITLVIPSESSVYTEALYIKDNKNFKTWRHFYIEKIEKRSILTILVNN